MNLSPRTARTALISLAISALLLGGTQTATADELDDPGTPEKHCTYDLEHGRTACYADLPAALRAASAPEAGGGAQDVTAEDYPEGSVILGTFFTEPNFGGSTYTVWGGSPCEADGKINWHMASFPDWARSTNSLQTWANCGIYVYSEEDLEGDRDGRFDGNVADIGPVLGDRVASASFH